MKTNQSNEFLDNMSRDPENWKGVLYFNKKDPRVFVPKLYPSMGWTINFSNINTYFLIAGFILIMILIGYFF